MHIPQKEGEGIKYIYNENDGAKGANSFLLCTDADTHIYVYTHLILLITKSIMRKYEHLRYVEDLF